MLLVIIVCVFFFQAEDGIRDLVRSRGVGDVYKRQAFKGLAKIEQTELHDYLVAKNKKKTAAPTLISNTIKQPATVSKIIVAKRPVLKKEIINYKGGEINPVNAHVLPAMHQTLILKSYSASTIKTYTNEVGIFLRTIKHHSADSFSTKRLKDYLQYCSTTLGLTENTLHSRINALKFYYEQVLKKEKLFWEIPRPKKSIQLPKVLSKEEMIRLIRSIDNVKHKTMIMLAYAVRRLPYALRSCVAALQQVHVSLEEAAESLGATKLRTIRRVLVPLMAGGAPAPGPLTSQAETT